MAIADGEELVDQMQVLREEVIKTNPEVQKLKKRYEEANERVAATPGTNETAEEELFDYLHALDAAVAKKLFAMIK